MEKGNAKSNARNLVNLIVIGNSVLNTKQYSPQISLDFREIRKPGHVYNQADIEILNGKSLSDNVHETILKEGLDYLAECARKGEDVEEKVFNALGRAYDLRPDWHMDYQIKLMHAIKEGKREVYKPKKTKKIQMKKSEIDKIFEGMK